MKVQTISDILETQVKSIGNVTKALKYQALFNADQLEEFVKAIANALEKQGVNLELEGFELNGLTIPQRLSVMTEELFKKPVRRQLGVIRGIEGSVKESKRLADEVSNGKEG